MRLHPRAFVTSKLILGLKGDPRPEANALPIYNANARMRYGSIPQPQPVPQTKPLPRPEPKPKPKPNTRPIPMPQRGRTWAMPPTKDIPKPEPVPRPKPKTQTEPLPQTKSKPQPQPIPQPRPNVDIPKIVIIPPTPRSRKRGLHVNKERRCPCGCHTPEEKSTAGVTNTSATPTELSSRENSVTKRGDTTQVQSAGNPKRKPPSRVARCFIALMFRWSPYSRAAECFGRRRKPGSAEDQGSVFQVSGSENATNTAYKDPGRDYVFYGNPTGSVESEKEQMEDDLRRLDSETALGLVKELEYVRARLGNDIEENPW